MSIEDDIAILDRVPTLTLLGREALRIIAISAESRVVRGGDILFREGQTADSAYVVTSGAFALTQEHPGRRRDARPSSFGPGTLIGELALFTETRRPVTATATELSSVLRIPRSIFRRTLESYPDAAGRLSRLVAQRLSETMGELDGVRRRLDAIKDPVRPERG
ncbi:MAG TPA: cyclic nucleotide-binding domain-containing protein [Xanthobacteraceae bacterium]|nr:cyclic nucleotide-binding domain-containing protein [Xanthobacteraceae bacterium]